MEARHHRHTNRNESAATANPGRFQRFIARWVFANLLISGVLSLVWLVLRSGPKPSRLAYPCQQAAFSTASLAFGVPLVAALVAAWRRTLSAMRTPIGLGAAGIGLFATLGVWGYLSAADAYQGPPLDPPRDYRATIYQVTDCHQDPIGDHFDGLENLMRLMGRDGLKFYQSANASLLAGPDGIVAADDVVVVKINYQWAERGGTNTDLLRGLLRCIVDHPDGFTGEIVVCENAQSISVEGFDRYLNNAQMFNQSPHDVVMDFRNLGYTVSHFDWTSVRFYQVVEYSEGDMDDGYVVGEYNGYMNGRRSYPKFRTDYDTHISLKYGIWDSGSSTYDRQRLKFINVPILKSHSAWYGATAAVKHYMGVVTNGLGTNSHYAIERGILGAVMAEIHLADLNIMDSIWINAHPQRGPATTYGDATRLDQLLAGTDPVALDIWAVKNLLIPGFFANGYSPPWPRPSADPDDPHSEFREYLDRSMAYILDAGHKATNDLSQIDALTWNPLGDLNCDGAVDFGDINPFVLALTDPSGYAAAQPDCNIHNADISDNGELGVEDVNLFVMLLRPTFPVE